MDPETLKVLPSHHPFFFIGILRNVSPVPAPSALSAVDIDRTVILPLILPVIESVSLSDASQKVLELGSSEVRFSSRFLSLEPIKLQTDVIENLKLIIIIYLSLGR